MGWGSRLRGRGRGGRRYVRKEFVQSLLVILHALVGCSFDVCFLLTYAAGGFSPKDLMGRRTQRGRSGTGTGTSSASLFDEVDVFDAFDSGGGSGSRQLDRHQKTPLSRRSMAFR